MRAHGYTLTDLLIAVVIAGILASLAAPSLSGYIAAEKCHGALNRFAADLYWARMRAARNGDRVELRLENSGACPRRGRLIIADGWSIVDADGGTLRTVPPGDLGRGLCLESNGDASIAFNSRSLLAPFENRTVLARSGGHADTLTISVLGRVLRRF